MKPDPKPSGDGWIDWDYVHGIMRKNNPVGFTLVVGFILVACTVGPFAAFCEFFYIESGDWPRVLRATITISAIASVIGVIGTIEVHRHYPDYRTPLYLVCLVPISVMAGFVMASGIAFLSVLLVTPLVFLVSLFGGLFGGSEPGDVMGEWESMLRWSITISYILGGLRGVFFAITIFKTEISDDPEKKD